jgi:hypothetical protein
VIVFSALRRWWLRRQLRRAVAQEKKDLYKLGTIGRLTQHDILMKKHERHH